MKKSLIFLIAGSLLLSAALHGAVFQDHLDLFNKAVAAKDLNTAEKHANDAIAMLPTLKPQTVVPGRCDILLRPFLAAKDFKTADKLYVSMICITTGNNKAILLDRYAKFLEKEKLATPDVIAKLKADRYAVADLTPALKVEFLIGDNRLSEAVALAEKMTLDRRTIQQFITLLKKKGVYGSPYAGIFYKKLLALPETADVKVVDIHTYVDFCIEFALTNVDEQKKLLESRSKLTGLTENGIFEIKLYDFMRLPDNEARAKQIFELADLAKNEKLCSRLSDALGRLRQQFIPEYFVVYEKNILPALQTSYMIIRCSAAYVTVSRDAGRYKNAVQYLTNLARKERNNPYRYIALANCYDAFALRYYADPDPALLAEAMKAYLSAYELLPVGSYASRIEILLRLADLAARRKNRAEVERYANMAKNMEIPDSFRSKKECDNAKVLLFAIPRATVAYLEKDYQAVVGILKPVIGKRQNFAGGTSPDNGSAYEMLVRSLVALGEYEEALKYTDDMIRTAPGYMRKRLQIQVDELKERAAE